MNLGRETETLEFKKSTGELKEGIISIGAILNKHQKGELYFGVRPDGTPIGQEISEKNAAGHQSGNLQSYRAADFSRDTDRAHRRERVHPCPL